MTPDDPRHGRSAGYWAGCSDDCCREAINTYSRRLRARQYLAGGSLIVDALGTKRRIRALMALGWTGRQIDAELGRAYTYTANLLCGPDRIHRDTVALVSGVYDRLSMRLPESHPSSNPQTMARTRNQARAKGWLPPLAWDDIDDPAEGPSTREADEAELQRWTRWWTSRGYADIDEAVVLALVDGRRVPASKPERVEAMRRWLSTGRSERSLCEIHNWHEGRYVPRQDDERDVA